MRNVLILFAVLAFIAACSKDEFNPLKPKDGQKAELFVDHYRDVNNQRVFLWPENSPSPLSLREFDERELGYVYKVRAKVVVSKHEIADGPNSWFELVDVISKEKYEAEETFEIGLVGGDFFGSYLSIAEDKGQLLYGDLLLNPIDEVIKKQLKEFIQQNAQIYREIMEAKEEDKQLANQKYAEYQEYLRKLTLKAIVSHDPENFGKGFLVHSLKFNE
jgi:hypothetical protein